MKECVDVDSWKNRKFYKSTVDAVKDQSCHFKYVSQGKNQIAYLYTWMISVPFAENGQAGLGEGHCSGGEMCHSASENFLHIEIKITY